MNRAGGGWSLVILVMVFCGLVSWTGCSPAPPTHVGPDAGSSFEAPAGQSPATSAPASDSPPGLLAPPPAGTVLAPWIRARAVKAHGEGVFLVVYVGATWCEPCRYFKKALKAGELDLLFPGLAFVEFDLDQHGDMLKEAGYKTRMIPAFIVPDSDGRGSEHRMSGSIKGPGAVNNIVPRLTRLLTEARR